MVSIHYTIKDKLRERLVTANGGQLSLLLVCARCFAINILLYTNHISASVFDIVKSVWE